MLANSKGKNNNKRDKLSSGPFVTESLATSTSSNLTIASAGAFDNHHNIIPGSDEPSKKEE